jgi:hypothetical protein
MTLDHVFERISSRKRDLLVADHTTTNKPFIFAFFDVFLYFSKMWQWITCHMTLDHVFERISSQKRDLLLADHTTTNNPFIFAFLMFFLLFQQMAMLPHLSVSITLSLGALNMAVA